MAAHVVGEALEFLVRQVAEQHRLLRVRFEAAAFPLFPLWFFPRHVMYLLLVTTYAYFEYTKDSPLLSSDTLAAKPTRITTVQDIYDYPIFQCFAEDEIIDDIQQRVMITAVNW